MGLRRFAREHLLYLGSCMGETKAVMPPRWKFFEDLAAFIPEGTETIVEFGPGSGRLMETVVTQRKLLTENGVYIAVDCNDAFLDFIRRDRPELAQDKRVHLVKEWAQKSRGKLEEILEGRKVQVVVLSIPFSSLPPEDAEELWSVIRALSAKNVRVILYCVLTTRQMMLQNCGQVHTYKSYGAHYGLPPALEVNVVTGLRPR